MVKKLTGVIILLLFFMLQSCSEEDNNNFSEFDLNFKKAFFGKDPQCSLCQGNKIELVLAGASISYIEEDSNGDYIGNFIGDGPLLSFDLRTNEDGFISPGIYTLPINNAITPMTYDWGGYVKKLSAYRNSFAGDYQYRDNCFIEISYNEQNQIVVNYEIDLYDVSTDEFATRIEGIYTGSYEYVEELPLFWLL